jgi:phosphoserine phosphatase RsbU/P
VTSVLEVEELLQRIPLLLARLVTFEAFAVYLLDERQGELRSAYTVGYPDTGIPVRLKPGVGLVGAAVQAGQPLLVNDVTADPRYVEFVPGMQSELVVPLMHKSRTTGALNVLSRRRNQFTARDLPIVRQFAAHVAVALANARLFERVRRDAEAFETLAEIGREVAADLDLDTLFPRIARLARRVIDYRTFGILLLNDRGELEMKHAVHYGEQIEVPRVALGEGSSATRRCTANRCSCPTCPRIRGTSGSSRTSGRSSPCRCSSRTAASACSIWRARSSTPSASATSRS